MGESLIRVAYLGWGRGGLARAAALRRAGASLWNCAVEEGPRLVSREACHAQGRHGQGRHGQG